MPHSSQGNDDGQFFVFAALDNGTLIINELNCNLEGGGAVTLRLCNVITGRDNISDMCLLNKNSVLICALKPCIISISKDSEKHPSFKVS